MESFKGLFYYSGNCMVLICIRQGMTTTSDRMHPLDIRKWKPYKNFQIFNVKSYLWYTLQLLQFIWPAAWVCMFMLFHLLISSGCTTSVIYVRSSDQRSFVVSISRGFCQVPSSLFLNLSYFTSKDENSSRPLTGEKTIWYNVWNPSKRWYILI